jgi:hypothetical protein
MVHSPVPSHQVRIAQPEGQKCGNVLDGEDIDSMIEPPGRAKPIEDQGDPDYDRAHPSHKCRMKLNSTPGYKYGLGSVGPQDRIWQTLKDISFDGNMKEIVISC